LGTKKPVQVPLEEIKKKIHEEKQRIVKEDIKKRKNEL